MEDFGFCSGCGRPLDALAKNGYCPQCQLDMDWQEANSPVERFFQWCGKQFSRLFRRQPKLTQ